MSFKPFCGAWKNLLLLCSVVFLKTCVLQLPADAQPNIVYVLADDLGYGSTNSYGADPNLIQTPSIDRLATEGLRFTDASTPSSVCSPTRYSLLTGRYPWRSRQQWGVVNTPDPFLPELQYESLGTWLKDQGYNTSIIGKWHLGFQDDRMNPSDWLLPLRPGPLEMGFDYYFGVPQNHGDITGIYVENDAIFGLQSNNLNPYPNPINPNRPDFYGFDAPQRIFDETMDVLTNKAVDWLDQQSGSSDPFFMYFNPIAVHAPITPSSDTTGTSTAGPYGDFIHDLDLSMGRILDKLDAMGVANDTLVIFTSDNGGDIPIDPSSAHQQAIAAGLEINALLRGDKHTIWEGGTRVPFLARLPGTIPAGTVSDETINFVDSFATIAELVDDTDPIVGGAGGDSYSFLDVLTDPNTPGGTDRESMVTANSNGILAIRSGDWKYIEGEYPEGFPSPNPSDPQAQPQLYDLSVDPDEQNNVIALFPAIADQLQQELDDLQTSATSFAAPGDLNADGTLDMADLTLFAAGWKSDTSQLPIMQVISSGDVDLSGQTDFGDWFLVRNAFQQAGAAIPAGFSFVSVPEPSCALLLAISTAIGVLVPFRHRSPVRLNGDRF